MRRIAASAVALCVIFVPAMAQAQGLLLASSSAETRLPRPMIVGPAPQTPGSYKIDTLDVNIRLVDQVARVQVSQTFENTGSSDMEASFVFPLPYDGAIDQLTFMIDGKEYPARLLGAEEARRLYEEHVRTSRDPALLEWVGTGMFQTSVFPLPAGQKRTVTLRYAQVCRRDHGLTDLLFPLATAKYTSSPLAQLTIQASIESAVDIKNIYSPTHAVEIERADDRHATVKFEAKDIVPEDDFRLFYDVQEGAVGTSVLSYRPDDKEDGFLLLLASPEIPALDDTPAAKTILFVVDRSGSMTGQKIEQAKDALKFVLGNLREGDLFNIVAYDSNIEVFRPELQRFDDATRAAAIGFVNGLQAGGGTNLDGALQAALGQASDPQRPTYILFLTDGLPTVGEQNEAKIVQNARDANDVRARILAFGVGYDVNSRLLDKLARENFGQSEYVRPDENIEDHVSRVYRRIESPVLTDVEVTFEFEGRSPEDPQPVYRFYPEGRFDLFAGEQLVAAARYRQAGKVKVKLAGRLGDETKTYEFEAELSEKSNDESYAFVEKVWATRRVGQIIDEIDLHGQNDELVRELVELSTRHGILTQYTSFLADETTDLNALAANVLTACRQLGALETTDGRVGVGQRLQKGALQRAAQVPAEGDAFAFVPGDDGRKVRVKTVRNTAGKTFYCRDHLWVDSTVTDEQRAGATRVEQFSDEFFRLAARHGRRISPYLALDEALLVNLDGTCYEIVPVGQ